MIQTRIRVFLKKSAVAYDVTEATCVSSQRGRVLDKQSRVSTCLTSDPKRRERDFGMIQILATVFGRLRLYVVENDIASENWRLFVFVYAKLCDLP